MGYEAGAGLGKASQGITEPVQASRQKGQRGLGHYIEGKWTLIEGNNIKFKVS